MIKIILLAFVLTIILCLCNKNGFENKDDCPSNYPIYIKERKECHKCPDGYKYSKLGKVCWKCPSGYRRNILLPITSKKVCNEKGLFKRNKRRAQIRNSIRFRRNSGIIPKEETIKDFYKKIKKDTIIINNPNDFNNSKIYGNENRKYLIGKVIDDIFDVNKEFKLEIELEIDGIFGAYPYSMMFYNNFYYRNKKNIIYLQFGLNVLKTLHIKKEKLVKIEYTKTKNNLIVKVNGEEINLFTDESGNIYKTNFEVFKRVQETYPKDKGYIFEINKGVKKINYTMK